jgi:hypothetical protein
MNEEICMQKCRIQHTAHPQHGQARRSHRLSCSWSAQARIVYLLLKLNLYNDSRLQKRAQQVQSRPSRNRAKMTYFVKNVISCYSESTSYIAQQVQSRPSRNRVKMTYFVKNVISCSTVSTSYIASTDVVRAALPPYYGQGPMPRHAWLPGSAPSPNFFMYRAHKDTDIFL